METYGREISAPCSQNPAEIIECQERIGRIQEGWDADLAIYGGNPLELNSRVLMTIINGEIVFQKDAK